MKEHPITVGVDPSSEYEEQSTVSHFPRTCKEMIEVRSEFYRAYRKSLMQERTVEAPKSEYDANREIEEHEKGMMKFIDGARPKRVRCLYGMSINFLD